MLMGGSVSLGFEVFQVWKEPLVILVEKCCKLVLLKVELSDYSFMNLLIG